MMAPERVTVTISSSAGEGTPLTVSDAMRQLLDFFDLLSAAGGDEGKAIAWQLVDIAMNSPLRATAQAVSKVPGILAEPIARREKAAVRHSLQSVLVSTRRFAPTSPAFKDKAKSLFGRNTEAIGRTQIQFDEGETPTVIEQSIARQAVQRIEIYEQELKAAAEDHSRTEYGSVEGVVSSLTTHYGNPALRVRERLSGAEVVCVLSSDLAEVYGPQHNWDEVWSSKRLLLSGEITYKVDGNPTQVRIDDIEIIDPPTISFSDVAAPGTTGQRPAREFIESLWEGDDA